MRHHKIQKMLSLFVDGRLSSPEEQFIQNHITTCVECKALLTSFSQMRRAVAKPQVNVNAFFASRVLADLKSRQREAFWTVFDILPRPVVVTGLTLAIITLAIIATPYSPFRENVPTGFAALYGEQTDIAVSDDQALAIAIAAEIVTTGE